MWGAFNAAAKNATRVASGVIEQLQDDEYEVRDPAGHQDEGAWGSFMRITTGTRLCRHGLTFVVLPIAGAAA